MVNIEIMRRKIEITGHANYGEHGKDIVCSAVSVLFQNLIHSIKAQTDDNIEYTIESGDSFMSHKNLSREGWVLKNAFILGVRTIERQYPGHVTVTIKNGL